MKDGILVNLLNAICLTIAFHLPHCDLKIGCKGNAISTPSGTPSTDPYSSRTL